MKSYLPVVQEKAEMGLYHGEEKNMYQMVGHLDEMGEMEEMSSSEQPPMKPHLYDTVMQKL